MSPLTTAFFNMLLKATWQEKGKGSEGVGLVGERRTEKKKDIQIRKEEIKRSETALSYSLMERTLLP